MTTHTPPVATRRLAPPDLPLSPKVHDILRRIDDLLLRSQVEGAICFALAALNDLQRIHLPQDDFEEHDTASAGSDPHLELAPYVLAAVDSVNQLLDFLSQTFPAPKEAAALGSQDPTDGSFDLQFDLVDGPTGDSHGLTAHAATPVAMPIAKQVAEAAHAFGSMLRSRVLIFGDRLTYAVGQTDGWPLLAELDENKHRLTKAVQGLLFGILGIFASDARREEILPEYRSAVSESIQLRSALSDLSFHVGRFNYAIAKATVGETVPLVVALADRLARFSTRPEYRTLRAEDKKAVIDFRLCLFDLRHRRGPHAHKDSIPMGVLRPAVEGFSKFLESMQAINHREVLVLHDRQRLHEALERLIHASDLPADAACHELDAIIAALGTVQGRNLELDNARRAYLPADPTHVAAALIRWRALVENAKAPLG